MENNVVYENRIKHVEAWADDYLQPMPHLHKELEIIYVVNGRSHLLIDHNLETITDGDLFICFPNQVHCYERSDIGLYYLFTIVPDNCFGIKDLLYDTVPKSNVLKLDSNDEILKVLSDAVSYQGVYKETYQTGLINHVLALLLPKLSLTPRIKSNEGTLQNIINYCSLNFMKDLTLDDISSDLHLSKYHISHLLNKKLGISFTGYVNILRINNACDLLRKTNKSIANISEEVGFGSIRSFNRVFLQIMNMTPCEYRKKRDL